jgi:hypothetical protein
LLECHLMSHVSMQAGIGDDLICYMMPWYVGKPK